MRKNLVCLGLILALTLGIVMVPVLVSAAEYSFAGPPAFSITYPGGDEKEKTADMVWAVITGAGLHIEVSVGPIPAGIELKDYAEKGYKPGLESSQGAKAKMGDNKEITLSDGTKAYYSEMNWNHAPSGGTPITTMMVTVYKDGKYVNIADHPWDNYGVAEKIVKSLKFK